MESRVSLVVFILGVSGGGDFVEEEDGECWLVTKVFIFRRRASSLEALEARVTAKWVMAASRWSRLDVERMDSAIGAQ